MKNILSIILSASLVLGSFQPAFAGPKQKPNEGRQFSAVVLLEDEAEKVILDLENIEKVADEINGQMQKDATFGLTQKLADTIRVRFARAVKLMGRIYTDPNLDNKVRQDMLEEMAKAIGKLILQVAHNEGQDLDIKELKAELEAQRNAGLLKKALLWLPFQQFYRDFWSLVTVGQMSVRSNEGERVTIRRDTIQRDQLTPLMIEDLAQFAKEKMATLEPTRGRRLSMVEFFGETPEAKRDNEQSIAEMMLERDGLIYKEKKKAYLAYLGLSFLSVTIMPQWDFVGSMDFLASGSIGDGSAAVSSLLYGVFWLTAGLLKKKSVSRTTLSELNYLHDVFVDPEHAERGESTAAPVAKPSVVETAKNKVSQVVRSCGDYISNKFKK